MAGVILAVAATSSVTASAFGQVYRARRCLCSGTVITVCQMATLRDFLADSREALRQMIRDIKDGRADHLF